MKLSKRAELINSEEQTIYGLIDELLNLVREYEYFVKMLGYSPRPNLFLSFYTEVKEICNGWDELSQSLNKEKGEKLIQNSENLFNLYNRIVESIYDIKSRHAYTPEREKDTEDSYWKSKERLAAWKEKIKTLLSQVFKRNNLNLTNDEESIKSIVLSKFNAANKLREEVNRLAELDPKGLNPDRTIYDLADKEDAILKEVENLFILNFRPKSDVRKLYKKFISNPNGFSL